MPQSDSWGPCPHEADQKAPHACHSEVFTIATHVTLQIVRTKALCCDRSGQCPPEMSD